MKNKIPELDVVFSLHYLCRSSEGGSGNEEDVFLFFCMTKYVYLPFYIEYLQTKSLSERWQGA